MPLRRSCAAALLVAGLVLSGTAPAGSPASESMPRVVANVNPEVTAGGRIDTYLPVDGATVFVVSEDELWRTDGTSNGTFRLPEGCDADCPVSPRLIGTDGSRAYFTASDGNGVPALWITNGTTNGTRPLTAFGPGGRLFLGEIDSPRFLLDPESGRLFFTADAGDTGFEPWVSDGTPGGTRLLRDVSPGERGSNPLFGAVLDDGDGTVLFSADDNETGQELWATDGTPDGTRLVRNLRPFRDGSSPDRFASLGDRALFTADDGETGTELWRSDGTSGGTVRVADWTPGPDGTAWREVTAAGDRGFAVAALGGPLDETRELIHSDGTPGGTRSLGRFDSGGDSEDSALTIRATLGSRLLFTAFEPVTGTEPWVSNGTAAGTVRLADLCPGPCSSRFAEARNLGNRVVFGADDGVTGREPWTTDATAGGTRRLADLCPGACSSDPTPVDGGTAQTWLFADDGANGVELWRLAGAAPPVRLTDLPGGDPFSTRSGRLRGNTFVFAAATVEDGLALWASNGTPQTTEARAVLRDVGDAGSVPTGWTVLGDAAYFAAFDGARSQALYRTDGTAAGTRRVRRVPEDPVTPGPEPALEALTPTDDRLFFFDATDREPDALRDLWTSDGTEPGTIRLGPGLPLDGRPVVGDTFWFRTAPEGLWISDGTAEGTRRLADLAFGSEPEAQPLGDRLVFPAVVEGALIDEIELWASDGTPQGTRVLANLSGDFSSEPESLTVAGSRLFFTAGDEQSIRHLWSTDGTESGTVQVAAPTPLSDPVGLTAVGSELFFFAEDDLGLSSLWVVNGDGAARELARVAPRTGRFLPQPRAALGGELFFVSDEGQLWRSDGTVGGTRPIRLLPAATGQILGLFGVPGRLVLTTRSDAEDVLWLSDGTVAGTRPLQAFAGVGSEFVALGLQVYFRADDGRLGGEPWAFNLDGSAPPPPPPPPTGVPAAPRNVQAEGLPFGRIRLSWTDTSNNETRFVVQARNDRIFSAFETVGTALENAESLVVGGFERGRPFNFRVRAENGTAVSPWSGVAAGTSVRVAGNCSAAGASTPTLCLGGDRFEVQTRFRSEGVFSEGQGTAVPFDFSDDSGTFWFFDPDNVELVTKVLDARPVNGFFWSFYGALSDVEYWVVVTDTETETNVTYYNPQGNICGLGDTRSFPRPPTPNEGFSALSHLHPSSWASPAYTLDLGTAGAPCQDGPANLCLQDDRFRVDVSWRDPRSGDAGTGAAIGGTDDSGFFWFFDPDNVELVAKVIDGRSVNGNFWFFYGGLSDVEYEITVTDTTLGLSKTYHNMAGNICGNADLQAF